MSHVFGFGFRSALRPAVAAAAPVVCALCDAVPAAGPDGLAGWLWLGTARLWSCPACLDDSGFVVGEVERRLRGLRREAVRLDARLEVLFRELLEVDDGRVRH